MKASTRAGVAGIACLIGLTVAGCSTDAPRATSTTSTVTRTVTAAPSSEAPAPAPAGGTDSDAADAPDTAPADPVAGGSPCGPYPDAAQKIAAATARIAPPSTQFDWKWGTIRSVMTSCNQLSWAELTTDRGTASSADQLLLFGPDGTWLGTGIKCNASLAWVTGSGSDHVDVHYGYFHGPHPSTADPGGGTDVTFRWNGSRVVLEGTLPQEFLDQCQQPS